MNERLDEEMEDVLRITLDSGEEKEFEILTEHRDPLTGKDYIFLLPLDEDLDDDDDEGSVIVYRYTEQGNGLMLEEIDNEEEWRKLESILDQFLDEEEA